MVRAIFLILLILSSLDAKKKTVYDRNCVECHRKIPVTIDKYFYRYLLEYSSEEDVKESMFNFIKNPTKEKSLMSESLIKRFGLKKKTILKDEEIKEAIDIYWNEYNLFDKLK